MKLQDCTRAYGALLELMDQPADYRTAYALVCLKEKLQLQAAFYAREEMKLVEACAAKDEAGQVAWTGPGKFRFASGEAARDYSRRLEELGEIQVEPIGPYKIPKPEKISPGQLEALLPFLEVEA